MFSLLLPPVLLPDTDLDGLPVGVMCTLFLDDEAGVAVRTRDGVNGSGGKMGKFPLLLLLPLEVFKLVLDMLSEHVDSGTGTLKLEERDWRPPFPPPLQPLIKLIPGDFGSGVREIDTPEIYSVGDFGIPVSDSYSLELSVSKGYVLHFASGLLQILIRRLEEVLQLR